MLRHPQNTNLSLWNEPLYMGWRVMTDKGPLVEPYLARLLDTLDRALTDHHRTMAFRVDLRLPEWMVEDELYSNAIVQRFVDSFKAKITHNREVARMSYERVHETRVRYAWARELGMHGKPHYHFVFFLNNDAFCALGQFQVGRDNIFNRLQEAWASALGLSPEHTVGLVEMPPNPRYLVRADDSASIGALFYRASYLCKAATKGYGHGWHGFGTSRV